MLLVELTLGAAGLVSLVALCFARYEHHKRSLYPWLDRRRKTMTISMTPAQFEAAKAKLAADQAIVLVGDVGTIRKLGCAATYAFDGTKLTVTVFQRPFFVTQAHCEQEIMAFMQSAEA
jgi:hypothetical protein